MYGSPAFENHVKLSKRKFTAELEILYSRLRHQKLSQSFGSTFIPLSYSELPRIIHLHKFGSRTQRIFKDLLLQTLMKCESQSGNSSLITFLMILNLLKATPSLANELSRQDHQLSGKKLLKKSRRARQEQLQHCLHKTFRDKFVDLILEQTLQLAGPIGQVLLDKKHSKETAIELYSGYCYKLSIPEQFKIKTKIVDWTRMDVQVLIIDGLIERTSELHHFLESISQTGEPGIIFARGFEDDVLETLGVNFLRKTLDVIPIITPYSLEGANLLKDIATICGGDVRSSLKGDLISTIRIEDASCIKKITIQGNKIILKNNKTKDATRLLRRELRTRLKEELLPEGQNLITQRLAGLSDSCVNIKLGDNLLDKKGIVYDRIEMGLKLTKDISNFGVITLYDISLEEIHSFAIKETIEQLIDMGFKYFSAKGFYHGIENALSLFECLEKCNTIILTDQT